MQQQHQQESDFKKYTKHLFSDMNPLIKEECFPIVLKQEDSDKLPILTDILNTEIKEDSTFTEPDAVLSNMNHAVVEELSLSISNIMNEENNDKQLTLTQTAIREYSGLSGAEAVPCKMHTIEKEELEHLNTIDEENTDKPVTLIDAPNTTITDYSSLIGPEAMPSEVHSLVGEELLIGKANIVAEGNIDKQLQLTDILKTAIKENVSVSGPEIGSAEDMRAVVKEEIVENPNHEEFAEEVI